MSSQSSSQLPGSPPAKKALFNSSPGSPTSSHRVNITGYLTCVGEVQTSRTKNTFFDIEVKVGLDTLVVVRVMEMGLSDKAFFTDNFNKVIRLTQVADKGKTLFYNEKYGALKMVQTHTLLFANSTVYTEISQIDINIDTPINVRGYLFWIDEVKFIKDREIRDAVLSGENGNIAVSIWNVPVIDSLEEGIWYVFHNMLVKMFNTIKLSTSIKTVIMRCVQDDLPDITKPDVQRFMQDVETVHISDVVSVEIRALKVCVMNKCSFKFTVEDNQEMTRCPKCKQKQKVQKMVEKTDGTMVIDSDGVQRSLNFDLEVFASALDIPSANNNNYDAQEDQLLSISDRQVRVTNGKIVSIVDTALEV